MKTAKVIFDVQAREGIVARASMHRDNPTEITVSAREYPIQMPTQVAVMTMVNYCLTMLREAAEKDHSIKGRYVFIVPENVAIRFFEAQKCVNNGTDIMSTLFKPWMNNPQYSMDFEDEDGQLQSVNVWQLAIAGLAEELKIMMDKASGWSLGFINSRSIYRYEIKAANKGVDIADIINEGDTITLTGSVDINKGIVCTENNFINGTFEVSRRDVRDRQNNITPHYYVPRTIQAINEEDGSTVNATADQILANENLEPVYQNGVLLVNAAFLRTKTAEQLPRIQRIKRAQVNAVGADSRQF